MPKYQVIAGKHHHREEDGTETEFNAGDVIELSEEQAAKWENKFRRVEEVGGKVVQTVDVTPPAQEAEPAPAPKAPAAAPKGPAAPQAQRPAQTPQK